MNQKISISHFPVLSNFQSDLLRPAVNHLNSTLSLFPVKQPKNDLILLTTKNKLLYIQ